MPHRTSVKVGKFGRLEADSPPLPEPFVGTTGPRQENALLKLGFFEGFGSVSGFVLTPTTI